MNGAPVFGLSGLGFSLEERVEVRAFRRWRPGRVTAPGRIRVTVEYWTRDGLVRHAAEFRAQDVRRPCRPVSDPPAGDR